ncbi:MAG: hypothetical protein R2849_07870 [Thermomicrobiales bacterium]
MARAKFWLLLMLVLAPAIVPLIPTLVAAEGDDAADQSRIATTEYGDVRRGQVSAVSEFQLALVAGESVTIETVNISEGGDPVLHLLDAGRGTEVAVNNSADGGLAARVSYTAAADINLILVVRSLAQETAGTTDLLKNGETWKTAVPFAGLHQLYGELIPGQELRTVHQPGGTGATHRMYIIGDNRLSIAMRVIGGGPNGAAIARFNDGYGKPDVIVGVANPESAEEILLVLNDYSHDADGDGLGDNVEAAIGTCSALSGFVSVNGGYEFDCSLAADPRDTDGDGISDGLELFGLYAPPVLAPATAEASQFKVLPDVTASFDTHINLPLWGANPRHKDLFIEVDFMMRSPGETPGKVGPAVARQFAAYYSDTVDNPIPLIDLYRAVSLKNPDGRRGISTHLDTGVAPESPADATIYGDWGGYNAVQPVQNADGSYMGDNPQTAWQNNMNPARRGIFRYIMVYPTGGGQNPLNSFAGSGPLDNAWVLAHEFAHAMGLDHGGKPGEFQPNCKPNYMSLLNYGYQGYPNVGFSDGLGTSALNNTALKEFNAVPPSNTAYLDMLEFNYKYYVDRENGHVDWNRDGFIAGENSTVRAYANYKPGGGGCEMTRMNQSMIPTAASTTAPAMARLGNRLYVFYSPLGAAFYKYSTDAGNCPQADMSACATWSDQKLAYMDAQGGIDAIKISNSELLVVTIDSNGTIWERRMMLDAAGNETWTDHRQVPGLAASPTLTSGKSSEPSLSELAYCKFFLTYRGADGNVHYNSLSCADQFTGWGAEQTALDQDRNPIPMAEYASPGVGRAFLSTTGEAWILGAFADVNGRLNLYHYSDETGLWAKTDLIDSYAGAVEGRPAMAWQWTGGEFDRTGKLYLMYVKHDFNTANWRGMQRQVRMLTSYVKVDKAADGSLTRTTKVGLEGPFDNVWLYAFGIDLFFEEGIDSNLRAALSIAIDKPELWAGIQFRPKADGVADLTMVDNNDWEVLRIGLCKNVVNPGGLVSNPIACPAG